MATRINSSEQMLVTLCKFVRFQLMGCPDADVFITAVVVAGEHIAVQGSSNKARVDTGAFIRAWIAMSRELDKAILEVAAYVAKDQGKETGAVLAEFIKLRDDVLTDQAKVVNETQDEKTEASNEAP